MAAREPPAITLTTTTSPPTTQTTTTSYTIGGRRNRNTSAASNTNTNNNHQNIRPTTPIDDGALEPFPTAPTSMEPSTPGSNANRNSDYFAQTPLQYQVRQRPIGIRRLPSSTDVQSSDIQRQRSNSGLRRRRTNTAPSEHPQPPEIATAGLAGLPGHYEVGNPGAMGTIVEGQEAHHGEDHDRHHDRQSVDSDGRVGRSGSTRLRRATTAARSILSKLSDDPEEDNLRTGRPQTGSGRNYESDVVDYLDVLGRS